jgi:hypothetical protein
MAPIHESLISDAQRLIKEEPTTNPAEMQHRIKVLANAVVAVANALKELEKRVPKLMGPAAAGN